MTTAVCPMGIQQRRRLNFVRRVLVGIELVVSVGAVYGGVGLIWNDAIQMPDSWLVGTPFHSWVLPGLLLLGVVAAPMAVAAVAELRRSRWAYSASVVAGAAQVGWIIAQWVVMQRFNPLQPAMLAAGVVVLALAWFSHRGEAFLSR